MGISQRALVFNQEIRLNRILHDFDLFFDVDLLPSTFALANYGCKIDEYMEVVEKTEDKSTLNFSDLARTYESKNIQGKQVSSCKI